MELRRISAFVAVFEEGSFNRAAQRLDIAQPSVSAIIKHLEMELGIELFERLAHGARPLSSAEVFYRHCLRILAEVDSAQQAVTNSAGKITGRLSAGLGPTIAKGLMPRFLPRFLDDYPDVEVRIAEAFSGPLIDWTLSGQLDFAIVVLPSIDRRLVTRRLGSEPILLVSSKERSHRSRVRKPLKLILPAAHNGLREILDRYIRSTDLPVERFVEVDSLHGMVGMVRESDWVTMASASSVAGEIERGDLVAEALDPPLLLDFYLIHPARRALSMPAAYFVERLEVEFEKSKANFSRIFTDRL